MQQDIYEQAEIFDFGDPPFPRVGLGVQFWINPTTEVGDNEFFAFFASLRFIAGKLHDLARIFGFLSLGVERFTGERGRLSYLVWRENGVIPILVLEVVSQTYRGEYKQKKIDYAEMGVLYYVIYDANRNHGRRGEPFEVHRLVDGVYVLQQGEPVWMPEIGLSIGRETGTYEGWTREWLYWYDQDGRRFPSPDEVRQLEAQGRQLAQQQAEQERQRAEQLAARLRALGIDPDEG